VTEYAALGFDPAPGDAQALDGAGAAWLSLAEQLAAEADGVNALRAGLTWTGRAADACLARMHVVPGDLQTAADACRSAGRTLRGYAGDLRRLQAQAAAIEAGAAEQLRAARAAVNDLDAQAAQRQLATFVRKAWQVHDDAAAAAQSVAAVLAAARTDAPHQPGWFHRMLHDLGEDLHHVAHAMHDLVVRYAPEIAQAAAWCSKAASILAEVGFFVSLVPVAGDFAGGVILAAGIGLGAAAMAGHAALAAAGVGSWKTVGLDGAGLAVSFVSKGMENPIEAEVEVDAAEAATRAAALRDLPSMTQKEFVLRTVRLHVDGAAAALGTVDLARIGEDWPVMAGRRQAGHAA